MYVVTGVQTYELMIRQERRKEKKKRVEDKNNNGRKTSADNLSYM
jgi:hypothetical protein